MQTYKKPTAEIVKIDVADILTTSPGTETPWYEENDGIWELSVNP